MNLKVFRDNFPVSLKSVIMLMLIIGLQFFFYRETWIPMSILICGALLDGHTIVEIWISIFPQGFAKKHPKIQLSYSLILTTISVLLHWINFLLIENLSFLLLPIVIILLLLLRIFWRFM